MQLIVPEDILARAQLEPGKVKRLRRKLLGKDEVLCLVLHALLALPEPRHEVRDLLVRPHDEKVKRAIARRI